VSRKNAPRNNFFDTFRKATCLAVSYTVRGRMMAQHTKRTAILLAALCVGVMSAATAHAAETTTPQSVTHAETAVVRVVVQQADGKTLRATKVVHWGDVAQFELGGHELAFEVTDRHHLSMSYHRDGSKVADKQFDAAPRASIVAHDDAGAKVTVKVIPTKVHVETQVLR
jgi:Cu/Ag efflux protein CusF